MFDFKKPKGLQGPPPAPDEEEQLGLAVGLAVGMLTQMDRESPEYQMFASGLAAAAAQEVLERQKPAPAPTLRSLREAEQEEHELRLAALYMRRKRLMEGQPAPFGGEEWQRWEAVMEDLEEQIAREERLGPAAEETP